MFQPVQPHVFKNKDQRRLLGEKLALARLTKGYSQAEALRASGLLNPDASHTTHEGGVTRGFLTYVEAGTRGVTKDQLSALAKLYGVSYKSLIDPAALTASQVKMLKTLQLGMKHRTAPTGTKKSTSIGAGRTHKVMATANGRRTQRQATVPQAAPQHGITPADIAMLDVVRDCSEPEKVWLRDGLIKLKDRMRSTVASPTKQLVGTR